MSLTELRLSKQLTQQELATRLGVKRSTVAMWESSKAFPQFKSLQKLAKVFRCSIDRIIKIIKKDADSSAKTKSTSQTTKLHK